MKMTVNEMESTKALSGFSMRFVGLKSIMVLFGLLWMIGSAQAQSINDWVGNRNLVNGTNAITRLKDAARVIIDQGQNPSQSSTAVANGNGNDFSFIVRIGEEIKINNRTSKDAINEIAIKASSEGMSTQEVTRLVQVVVSILS
jgi:hypothetical protein